MRLRPVIVAIAGLAACRCGIAVADEVDDLRGRLQAMTAAQPVAALVSFEEQTADGEAQLMKTGRARISVRAMQGLDGLSLNWTPELLQKAAAEARAYVANPELPTPTRDALQALSPVDVGEYFNSVPRILNNLEGVKLLSQSEESLEGRPVRRLTFAQPPHLDARERKYINEVKTTYQLWLDADGYPVAADKLTELSGSFMVVIRFSSRQHQAFRYARVGDRLVTLRHAEEATGSGAGQKHDGWQVTELNYGNRAELAERRAGTAVGG